MAPRLLIVDDNQELLGLLTQLMEDAGYDVVGASRGKSALEAARMQPVQLAILDVLLPDMMGYQLAEQLRKELPDLPVAFLTGVFKGGRHALEAKQKYSAVGYFEKPFDAKQLVEAIGKVVPPEKREPRAESAEDAFEVELDIDVEDEQPVESMELTGRIKVSGGGGLTAELRGANLTATSMASTQSTIPRPPPEGKPALSPPTRAQDPRSRRGELTDNLPSLITAFYLARETGELGIQRGKVKKVIYFEAGQPVFALSNLLADRFGQFLVRVGKIKAEQLADATAVAQSSKRRTGDILVERGLLKDTERLYYVGQQVKSIIYSLFGWEDGTYVMSFRDRAGAESIKLDIHPANLIVRGVKKLYKPDRMRRLVSLEDRLMPSLSSPYQLNDLELEKWEAELLPNFDGTRTVTELLGLTTRPENAVYGFIVAMKSLGILELRQG